MQSQIYFAHANGFPAGSYNKMFTGLRQHGYAVDYLDQHAHNSRFPVNNHWEYLVDELIFELEQRYARPVIGVGHSLGGVLCSFAAARRPELFSSVVMLDSFVLNGAEKVAVSLAKRLGMIDHMTPAGRTRDRRERWRNVTEAREYFSHKKLFRYFDAECMDDYLKAGLTSDSQGLSLSYKAAIEVSIYRNMPHRVPTDYHRFTTPTGLIYGDHSNVMISHRVRTAERNTRLIMQKVTGSHMFPLEHPQTTANHIHRMVKSLDRQGEEGAL